MAHTSMTEANFAKFLDEPINMDTPLADSTHSESSLDPTPENTSSLTSPKIAIKLKRSPNLIGGAGRMVLPQAKEVIVNVYKYLKETGNFPTKTKLSEATGKATGISRTTVSKIIQECGGLLDDLENIKPKKN